MAGDKSRLVVLVRIYHERSLTPRLHARLLQRLSTTLLGAPLVVRVSSRWVEMTVFANPSGGALSRLAGILGAHSLEVGVPRGPDACGPECLSRYRRLLGENRFWEAHEVGEAIWASTGRAGQALAALAGTYAKAQEGMAHAARGILCKALAMIRETGLSDALDALCLRAEMASVYSEGWGDPGACIEWRRLERLLSGEARSPRIRA